MEEGADTLAHVERCGPGQKIPDHPHGKDKRTQDCSDGLTACPGGADPYTSQEPIGYNSFSTTQRYSHHYAESLRRGIGVLERFRQGNQQERVTILSQ